MDDFVSRKCAPCQPGTPAMDDARVGEAMGQVAGWERDGSAIVRTFAFKNYYQTLSFVNAVAWIAHSEDHHPEITFGYKTCRIRYSTHSVGGLSENDFICAAKINALL